jgi:hypothetical protein
VLECQLGIGCDEFFKEPEVGTETIEPGRPKKGNEEEPEEEKKPAKKGKKK